MNLASTYLGLATKLAVTNLNGFANNGVTTVNVSGALPLATPATYNLLTYAGTVQGSGSFVLGTIPNFPNYQAIAYLTNNAAAGALQLVIPASVAPSLTWVGAPTNNWDFTGTNNWLQTGTATPAAYADGNTVVFDDTASIFTVNLAAFVQPYRGCSESNFVILQFIEENRVFRRRTTFRRLNPVPSGAASMTPASASPSAGPTTPSCATAPRCRPTNSFATSAAGC